MKANIRYGVVDKNGNKFHNSNTNAFQKAAKKWHVRTVEKILKDGIGHCYDFTEVERYWFKAKKYKFHTFWVCAHEENESGFAHAYLVFQDKLSQEWVHFEVSDFAFRGLHRYETLNEAITAQANHQIEMANKLFKPKDKYRIEVYEFEAPQTNLSYMEYIENATKEENQIET